MKHFTLENCPTHVALYKHNPETHFVCSIRFNDDECVISRMASIYVMISRITNGLTDEFRVKVNQTQPCLPLPPVITQAHFNSERKEDSCPQH